MPYTVRLALACFCLIFGLFFLFNRGGSKMDADQKIDLGSSTFIKSIHKDAKFKNKHGPNKIAIVGAGMGGTSTAFFLRKHFDDDVIIDLYEETGHVGGRAATVEVAGRLFESGGAIIHPKNLYARTIANTLGLEDAYQDDGTIAFFDGKNYVLTTSKWAVVSLVRMLWKFGFDLFRLNYLEETFMNLFCGIYNKHERGESFTSVETLLFTMGKLTFINSTQTTSQDLFTEDNIGENMLDILVNGGLRVNYGQSPITVNGFVGLVSMAGIQPGLWSVKGGNYKLCQGMVDHSKVNLIPERVTQVTYQENNGKRFSVSTKNSENPRSYDIVVIATPINQDKSTIDLNSACSSTYKCPSATKDPRHFKRTVATFVKGKINSKLFQCDSIESCPGILTITDNLFYRTVGYQLPVDFDVNLDNVNVGVYKVFSGEPLNSKQLNILFESYNETKIVDWYAYPEYQPPEQLDSFVLNDEGLYYTSPIEWAASAMEMSLISGKNAALLAFNNWYGLQEKINPKEKDLSNQDREDL